MTLPKKRAGRPRAASEETRDKLLEAATRLFSENGMAATSLAKVAAAAGVTSAMVHYYFKTKEQLIEAVGAEKLGPVILSVLGADYDEDKDVLQYLLQIISRLAQAAEDNSWLPGLWLREIVSEGGGFRQHIINLVPKKILLQLAVNYKEGCEAGQYASGLEPSLLIFSALINYMLPLTAKNILEKLPGVEVLTTERLISHAHAVITHGLSVVTKTK